MGFAFQRLAFDESYIPSTRRNRVSHGQNIFRGIFVAIMFCIAFWAVPVADAEIHFGNSESAGTACLAARKPAVNLCDRLSITLNFVFQHLNCSSNRRIRNTFGQTVVVNHTSNIKILNKNIVKSSDNICCDFIEMILTTIGNVRVDSGNFKSLPIPSTTAFLASGEDFLCFRKLFLVKTSVTHIWDMLAIRESCESRNTKVNSNILSRFWNCRKLFVKAECDEISTSTVLGYRNRAWRAFELSAPANSQSSEFGYMEIFILNIPFEGRCSIFSRLFAMLRFEGWVLSLFLEKFIICRLKVPKCLLSWDATNFVKPRELFLLFEGSKSRRRFMISDLLSVSKCIGAKSKSPVIDESCATKCSGEVVALGFAWIESESISCLHTNNISHVIVIVKNFLRKDWRFLP